MALTFSELKDELAAVLGTGTRSGDAIRTSFGRWLNQAFRTIAYAYPWDSMRGRQTLTTVAPYSTGTVAVALAGTTVTTTGATLTSGMVGRKFALSQGGPFYRILTVNTGAGTFTIDAYAEATVTASTYVIFQDEYDLAATTHTVEDVELVKDGYHGPIWPATQKSLDHWNFLSAVTGRPGVWSQTTSTTVGTPRIRVSPCPDDVYRIEVRYQKTWTALSGDSDSYATQGLPEDIEELAIDRALRWAPRIEGSRRVMRDDEWRRALAYAFACYSRTKNTVGTRVGIGSGARAPRIVLQTSGIVTA